MMGLRNKLATTIVLLLMMSGTILAQQAHVDNVVSAEPFMVSRLDMLSAPTGLTQLPALPLCQLSSGKMPIFCHIEHKMSQNSGIPVRIRLGNVQYVDQLEGKTKYTR